MLRSYIDHHLQYPDSLISKVFGVFTVKRAGMAPVVLCLMENTVQLKSAKMLRYKFDLKGSTLGRRTKGVVTSRTDRKDLDFVELKKKEPQKLSFAEINKHMLMILKRDVQYLQSMGLIDYSLLLAVELSTKKFKPDQLVEKRLKQDYRSRRHSIAVLGGSSKKHAENASRLARVSCMLLERNSKGKKHAFEHRKSSQFV